MYTIYIKMSLKKFHKGIMVTQNKSINQSMISVIRTIIMMIMMMIMMKINQNI